MAWVKKLLCSLVVWQQILLYVFADGSRVNIRVGVVISYPLGFAETSHFTDVSIVGLCFFRLVSPFSAGFPALASLAKSCEVSRELGDK